ncbi:MAG: hypothetical protein JXR63_08830 [Spirochaetales bacterium]|nr:hypothetical protein [Spirochaetales bacterium]
MKKIIGLFILISFFSCTSITIKEESASNTNFNNWAYIIVKNDIIADLPPIIMPQTGNEFYDTAISRADLLYQIGVKISSMSLDSTIKENYIREAKYHISLLDKLDPINDFRGKFSIKKAPEIFNLIVKTRNNLNRIANEIQKQLESQI